MSVYIWTRNVIWSCSIHCCWLFIFAIHALSGLVLFTNEAAFYWSTVLVHFWSLPPWKTQNNNTYEWHQLWQSTNRKKEHGNRNKLHKHWKLSSTEPEPFVQSILCTQTDISYLGFHQTTLFHTLFHLRNFTWTCRGLKLRPFACQASALPLNDELSFPKNQTISHCGPACYPQSSSSTVLCHPKVCWCLGRLLPFSLAAH